MSHAEPSSSRMRFSAGSWLVAVAIGLLTAASCLVGMIFSPIVTTAGAGIVALVLAVGVVTRGRDRPRARLHLLSAGAGLAAVLIFYWVSALAHFE